MPFDPTICACATATGGHSALLRLSGPAAVVIATKAGLGIPPAWHVATQDWPLAAGACPIRVLLAPAGRSFTGHDLIEIILPGSRDLIALALATLRAAGAESAPPGGFARQALANGRLTLDRAEAVLALATAPDAAAAALAIARLRGALASELTPVRERLLHLRVLIEAGLDFAEEEGVLAITPAALRAELLALRTVLSRWLVAAESLSDEPVVCLSGPTNAGKSALFARLTGAPALVSPLAGTTRDHLEAPWLIAGRRVRLIDTAGWLDAASGLDAGALAASRSVLDGAALVLACSAPDAPLPADPPLLRERTVVVATKADLGVHEPRAVLAVSVETGAGLDQLAGLVAARLGAVAGAAPRQQRLLAETDAILACLLMRPPADELLAEDLRTCADRLGDLLGATTPDEVLDAIFGRFCIGK